MIKIGFGRGIKPRNFDYKPRFYDPIKEEREERLKKYREASTQEGEIENLKDRIRTGIRVKQGVSSKSENKNSNIRLLMIIIILGMMSYVLLSSNKVIGLIEAFSR
jgi:hypothetical protein